MERLRELREAKKISQLKLGMKLDVAQETISGYEIGRSEPNLEMLVKLADALETSVDYLLYRTNTKMVIDVSQLSAQETELLLAFRKLDNSKKERAIGIILGLAD